MDRMNDKLIVCALCGHTYDPAEQAACGSCPLHRGCNATCCPACGYTTIDTSRSTLVQWLTRKRPEERKHEPAAQR
jgi:hypothetical protein